MVDSPVSIPIDAQDPLPEANWLWRRVFVFATTAAIMWMTWGAITRLGTVAVVVPAQGIPALLSLCKMMFWVQMILVTYYMVAPSAEQITKMMQTTSLLKGGVQFASRTTTTDTPGSTTTATAASASLPPMPAPSGPDRPGLRPTPEPTPTPTPDMTTYQPPMPEPSS